MIKTCAEIHRMLWYPDNLGIGQAYGNSPRDKALLSALSKKLNVPDESFILSSQSKNISAQQYLTAMLGVLEPLSGMFQDIWRYCERTFTRTSKNALDISWDFNFHGETIQIDFEAFRKYQRLLAAVPIKDKFNDLSNRFADVCSAYQGKGYGGPSVAMPAKPPYAAPAGVASRIHDLCTNIRALKPPEGGYWGIADAIATLSSIQQRYSLWQVDAFPELKEMLDECVQVIKPEDILSLPFWKYRWQIYELWCLITTLQLFERRGFELVCSKNGESLLELGQNVLIAEKTSEPKGQIFYQPSYLNHVGQRVHPDMVVVRGKPGSIQQTDVAAIVECKQHKMPEKEKFKALKERYFDRVAESYSKAISTNGKLVLVNYDKIHFQPTYTLIDEFTPMNSQALAIQLAAILREFSEEEQSRQVMLIVDGSTSMDSVFQRLQGKLAELHSGLEASDEVIFLSDKGPCNKKIQDIPSVALSGTESAELFIQGLRQAKKLYPLVVAHVITDLAPDCEIFTEIRQTCGDIAFRVHCIS